MTAANFLEAKNLRVGYGGRPVLDNFSVSLGYNEVLCLIGHNGAGKSTLLRALSGVLPATAGSIRFGGRDLAQQAPEQIVGTGLIHVPEGRRLFAGLSVRDNLLIGAYLRRDGKQAIRASMEEVFTLFPRLAERRWQDASTLSGGEQQMCAIGRGLMARPKLLLIDELSLGLAPRVVEELVAALASINAGGTALLVVEQDVEIALGLARHALVLDQGRVLLSGAAAELRQHPLIHAAYLGEDIV